MKIRFCPLCGAFPLARLEQGDDVLCTECNRVCRVDHRPSTPRDIPRYLDADELPAVAQVDSPPSIHVIDLRHGVEYDAEASPAKASIAKPGDGGPAFPRAMFDRDWVGDVECVAQEGMSLRDWFAGQVVTGQLSSRDVRMRSLTPDQYASFAYRVADAMLAFRSQRKEANHVSPN